jgi:hypothetical protein
MVPLLKNGGLPPENRWLDLLKSAQEYAKIPLWRHLL